MIIIKVVLQVDPYYYSLNYLNTPLNNYQYSKYIPNKY